MEQESKSTHPILVAEDDDAANFLLQIAFREVDKPFEVFRVSDGEQALAFLHREGRYHAAPRPALILLNLHMPRMTGFELLDAIKQDPNLRDIPAVVFSSSKLSSDRARCMALGALDFISKPDNYPDVVAALKSACAFI